MKILFLHPDLGIGGAERLVVDAGLALVDTGHDVHYVTSYHNEDHCFAETKNGTFNVTVYGNWFPRSLFGRFYALCAYIRMIIATVCLLKSEMQYDIVFCDQISASIPLIKWFGRRNQRNNTTPKVLFYCHYPDQLLTTRNNWLKKAYRLPLDWLEEITTGCADCILVNSNFTAGVFQKTFKRLASAPIQVLYPACKFSPVSTSKGDTTTNLSSLKLNGVDIVFLSINRYERKKNLGLAIRALAVLLNKLRQESGSKNKNVHLIVAGGYDERVLENIEYYEELVQLARDLNIEDKVSYLKSPSDSTKRELLHSCTAVVYTPENEHFGIVPIEAMSTSRPVIACNSGGPLETVIHEETGFLCDPDPEDFASAMARFAKDKSLAREYGINGCDHVRQKLSYETFKSQINKIVNSLRGEN